MKMAQPTRSAVQYLYGGLIKKTGIVVFFIISFQSSLTDSVTAPRFTEHPLSQVIKHHGKAVLRCHAVPDSAHIHWKFNGEVILSDRQTGFEINGGRLQILSFRHIKKDREVSHEGVYQCVANNSAGTVVSREATLERAFMGQFEEVPKDIEMVATEGNTALIPCTPPRGVPPPVTVFELNGVPIDESSKRHLVLPSGNLQIFTVKQADRGSYKCVSINLVSEQRRISPHSVILEVRAPTTNSPPQFVLKPVLEEEVIQGEDTTLECVVQGSPVPVVVWDKHKGELPEGRYTQVTGNLVIRDVQPSDQGTYICRAQNTIGPPMAEIANIKVIEPPNILFRPTDQVAIDGGTVAFQCIARGVSITTEWLFNGKTVVSNQQIDISDTSLTITRVTKNNEGIYQCVARSRLGMTLATALLQVKSQNEVNYTWPQLPNFEEYDPDTEDLLDPTEKPDMSNPTSGSGPGETDGPRRRGGNKNKKRNRNQDGGDDIYEYSIDDPQMVPPTAPEVKKLSDTSVLVRWNVPPNEGLAISFFKIQYRDISAKSKPNRQWQTYSVDIAPNLKMQEVQRLKTGATYKFRVLAVYSNHDNRWGQNSRRFVLDPDIDVPRPLTPKKGPVIVKANASSTDRITIQWQYNQEDKNQIEGFFIYVKPFSSHDDGQKYKKYTITGRDNRKFVIRDLRPSTHYTFKMTSFNTAGEGPISNEVVKETPAVKGGPAQPSFPSSFTRSHMSTTKRPYIGYPDDRQSTAKSNQVMYIALGIALGLFLLGLLLFMFICWRRQRKQRRGLNSSQSDSLRKKPQMNGGPQFLLHDLHPTNGGVNGKIGNGHVTTGYGGLPPNGTSHMGLTTNPFHHPSEHPSQFDNGNERNYSPEDLEIQSLRASLQEMLHQPPPPIPPERGAPQAYASVNRRHPHNYYEVDPNHQDTLPRMHMDTFGCPDCSYGSRPQSRAESHLSNQPPPDYNSLNTRGLIYSNRMSGGDYREFTGSLQRNRPMTNPYHLNKDHYRNSPDHIPRSHERPPFKPYNSQGRNIRTLPSANEPYEGGSPSLHDTSHGSIDPSEIYERVSDNQSLGSQGRPSSSRQRKHSPGMPPLLTSSLGYRSFADRPGHENSRVSPVISAPQPMKMGIASNPPRLPPRNITPVLYNNTTPISDRTQQELNQTTSSQNNYSPAAVPDQHNPFADAALVMDNSCSNISEREINDSSLSSSSSNNNKKESPQVIDDLSQDLPVISGSLGRSGTETDTLPSSSNPGGGELSLSENMDSDLEGMQLSDHEEDDDLNPLRIHSQGRNLQGSEEELAPLVVNPSQVVTTADDLDKSSENTPLMQRNIPRANDYPSDDDNEDV